jgi:hypothetical protein
VAARNLKKKEKARATTTPGPGAARELVDRVKREGRKPEGKSLSE